MTTCVNFSYDELQPGQQATYSRTIEQRHIQLFAAATGDTNPVHLDPHYAASTEFGEPIAHGMLTGGLISAALALVMPGPGTVFLSQQLRFRTPVRVGDTVTIELTVAEKRDRLRWVSLQCRAVNQDAKVVATGTAEVIAPAARQTVELAEEPAISIQTE